MSIFDSSENRRRTRADDEAAAEAQREIRFDRIERFVKFLSAAGMVLITGASGTAWHFYGRSEQMAEARGAERVRLERVERDLERVERSNAELRAIVAALYPALRNLPVIPPVTGDDR